MTDPSRELLELAQARAGRLGIPLAQAVPAILTENPALAMRYARDGEGATSFVSPSPPADPRDAHLARAMGRAPAARSVPIADALNQAAGIMVEQGLAASVSAAVGRLLQDPATARVYAQDGHVLGVSAGEIRLGKGEASHSGPVIATFPQHRHVLTGGGA
jgi:hypothetical protein